MRALTWDHNAHYHPLMLEHVPPRCERVLDVGCGTGKFAVRLAERSAHVDALDRSADMIEATCRRAAPTVTCIQADITDPALCLGPYDAITSISTLHHLALPVVLPRLASWLRPSGVLVATALLRPDLPRELPLEAAAVAFTNARGLHLALRRGRRGATPPVAPEPPMPVREPELTLRQVRQHVDACLPGAQLTRLLLWRYLLVWRKPDADPQQA